MNDVTRILSAIEHGNTQAAADLLPLVYVEIRKLAAQKMAGEAAEPTLQGTALVHEAYLWLVDGDQVQQWNSRGHFFAAEAMRRLLIENAGRKNRSKHGGDRRRIELDEAHAAVDPKCDILALDEALTELAAKELVKAKSRLRVLPSEPGEHL